MHMQKLIVLLRRHRRLALTGGAGAVVVLAAVLYFMPAKPVSHYLTSPASIGDIEDTVLATGAIEALQQVSVGAQVSGQLKSLKVKLGDDVVQGQLVAEIDSLTQQNALHTAEANLLDMKAQKQAAQASLVQLDLAYTRQKTLLAQDATSHSDVESADASLKSAHASLAELDARIRQAAIAVDTAKLNLAYTKITSPLSGKVVAIVTKEGQTVNASQSAPTIIKVARLDTVTVKAEISEADVTRVKPGQRVYFTILGEPDRPYKTTLRSVEPAPTSISTDTTSSTTTTSTSSSSTAVYYNGLLDVPNAEGKLRISMTTEVHIVLGEARKALMIPSSALDKPGPDGRYKLRVVLPDQSVATRYVRIGLNNRVNAQVLDGLRQGEQVIVGEANASTAVSSTNNRPGPPPGMM
jgi:macrolide-specific efflux system membrane fusion protein